jgi:hypothetical protein
MSIEDPDDSRSDERAAPERRTELVELTRAECLALLGERGVGRIAVVGRDELPLVVPVNYLMVQETVVFRTDVGTKLDALRRRPVAFQRDSIDPVERSGWSVLIRGIAHDASPHELESWDLEPWIGDRQHWIQVVPRHITGRRTHFPAGPDGS